MQFGQPDTLTLEPYNPQSWNRYSYTSNNPINATDPTGHCTRAHYTKTILTDDECEEQPPSIPTNPTLPKGSNNQNISKNQSTGDWLNKAAVVTQAIATAIDTGFAGGEIVVAAGGCIMTIEAGCIGGVIDAVLDTQLIYKFWGNPLEQGFSFLSLGFTVLADLNDDGKLGESTENSLVTFIAGQLTSDPIIDSAIDIYALGYSTGKFNGIKTIMNGGGLIRK